MFSCVIILLILCIRKKRFGNDNNISAGNFISHDRMKVDKLS